MATTETRAKTGAKAKAKTKAKTKAKAKTTAKTKATTETRAKTKTKTTATAKTKVAAKAKTKTPAKARATRTSKPRATAAPRATAKTPAKTTTKPSSKAATKAAAPARAKSRSTPKARARPTASPKARGASAGSTGAAPAAGATRGKRAAAKPAAKRAAATEAQGGARGAPEPERDESAAEIEREPPHRVRIESAIDVASPGLPAEATAGPLAFPAEPEIEAKLRRLLRDDPQRNLIERYEYLRQLNEGLAEQRLGCTEPIVECGWSILYFRAEKPGEYDLTYTVGLYYRYRFPELMVLTKGVDVERVKRALNRLGCAVALEEELDLAADQGDDNDLPSLRFFTPGEAQLNDYPFGLGRFFYKCMMDTDDIPLLMCQITPD